MSAISPGRLMAAMSAAQQLRSTLAPEDDTLAALIDAEADALALLDRLGEQAIADKLLAEVIAERCKRLEARSDRARQLMREMLTALDLRKLERPAFTASIQANPPSVVITNEAALPPEYLRISPDKLAIARTLKAGKDVPGATLSNTTLGLRLITR